jgi:hypothetical protein
MVCRASADFFLINAAAAVREALLFTPWRVLRTLRRTGLGKFPQTRAVNPRGWDVCYLRWGCQGLHGRNKNVGVCILSGKIQLGRNI